MDPHPRLYMLMISVFLRTLLTLKRKIKPLIKKIGKIATENYFKAANKQQIIYDAKRSKKEYGEGDTVGVCIHEVYQEPR